MVHISPSHSKYCSCDDYPCCGHTDNIPSEPEFDEHDQYDDLTWEAEEEEGPPPAFTSSHITELTNPITEAIDNLLADDLMDSIVNLMRREGLCGETFEDDEELAEQIFDKCMDDILLRFRRLE